MTMIFNKPLPGKQAQCEMAPPHRLATLLREDPQQALHAAVLVMLTPVNAGRTRAELMDWKVLLIRRNTYPGVHSGQIALPGGKAEPGDGDFWGTACREAFEEVGVRRECLEHVGPLSSIYVPPSNFMIHPFAAVNRSLGDFVLEPAEVVDCKNVPVKTFDPEAAIVLNFDDREGSVRPAPAWRYEDYTIWGATAMILAELFRLVDQEALIAV